jgi:hypothetical protein
MWRGRESRQHGRKGNQVQLPGDAAVAVALKSRGGWASGGASWRPGPPEARVGQGRKVARPLRLQQSLRVCTHWFKHL